MSNITETFTVSAQELHGIKDLLMRAESLISYLHDQYGTELTVEYLPTRDNGHEDATGYKTLEQHEELWKDYYEDERRFHESVASTLLMLQNITETFSCKSL